MEGYHKEADQHCRIIVNNYFYLVYQRYEITTPQGADWSLPQLPANVPWLIAVEVPRMLMELGDISEDKRIPAMLKLCDHFSGLIDESNFLNLYTTTVEVLINHVSSLGKMQVFCAFSAGYCVYLCKQCNIRDDAAVEVYEKALKIFQARFKFWLDCDHGWEKFLAEGRRLLREKQIAGYRALLVRKSIAVTVVAGLAVMLIATLRSKLGH